MSVSSACPFDLTLYPGTERKLGSPACSQLSQGNYGKSLSHYPMAVLQMTNNAELAKVAHEVR